MFCSSALSIVETFRAAKEDVGGWKVQLVSILDEEHWLEKEKNKTWKIRMKRRWKVQQFY